eukprot:Amastigsp_a844558_36.p2 type:complete len:320 gc:universal Amastigsp_a844558_36:769-1728(+)
MSRLPQSTCSRQQTWMTSSKTLLQLRVPWCRAHCATRCRARRRRLAPISRASSTTRTLGRLASSARTQTRGRDSQAPAARRQARDLRPRSASPAVDSPGLRLVSAKCRQRPQSHWVFGPRARMQHWSRFNTSSLPNARKRAPGRARVALSRCRTRNRPGGISGSSRPTPPSRTRTFLMSPPRRKVPLTHGWRCLPSAAREQSSFFSTRCTWSSQLTRRRCSFVCRVQAVAAATSLSPSLRSDALAPMRIYPRLCSPRRSFAESRSGSPLLQRLCSGGCTRADVLQTHTGRPHLGLFTSTSGRSCFTSRRSGWCIFWRRR